MVAAVVSNPEEGLTVWAQTKSNLDQITEGSNALYIDQNWAKCPLLTQKCGNGNENSKGKVYCGTLFRRNDSHSLDVSPQMY